MVVTVVRFRVRERLSARFASAVDGVCLDPSGGGRVLVGELPDASAVYGVIDRLRDLGLELTGVEVEPSATPRAQSSPS
jgi:hypothetical protein